MLWNNGSVTPTLTVKTGGTYSVTTSNSCGSASDTVLITETNCSVYVPSAFTPNGDNLNDWLRPVVQGQVAQWKFQVFDRWGNMVFQTTNPAKGWDGKLNAVTVNSGVFVWQCSYRLQGQQQTHHLKGTVAVLR